MMRSALKFYLVNIGAVFVHFCFDIGFNSHLFNTILVEFRQNSYLIHKDLLVLFRNVYITQGDGSLQIGEFFIPEIQIHFPFQANILFGKI